MCGRATLTVSPKDLRETLDIEELPKLEGPRFNIAPSQQLAVMKKPGRIELYTWGPSFINAKIESATTKPDNRCLIVIDGFYEWRRGDKQPFYFRRADRKPFTVAGVTRSTTKACAIVTCPAGPAMIDLHHRMPLIVERADWQRWLDGEKLTGTLPDIERFAVSKHVNSAKNDDRTCIEPV